MGHEMTRCCEWEIYPAIDLRQGRVVRLVQGDPALETEYGRDPVVVARRWQQAGANWLHVVNLDGALDESSALNLSALKRLLGLGLPIQFGGGLRDFASVRYVLELGVHRVVIGTAALENSVLLAQVLDQFGPDRVALAVDVRDGWVYTHGWRQPTGMTAEELAQKWAANGLRWLIFTDVARDGTGEGLNVETAAELARTTGLCVIASGGVATLADVERAYQAGLSGVIIGRALYDGQLRLEDALRIGAREIVQIPSSATDAVAERVAVALRYFHQGFSCSQAVLASHAPLFGLDEEFALRVAAAFGGGISRTGGICGALAGALMVIGLRYGKVRAEDEEAKERTYHVAGELLRRFRAQHGSVLCRDLLGCDISSPAGLQRAREQRLFTTVCPRFVREAVVLLSEWV